MIEQQESHEAINHVLRHLTSKYEIQKWWLRDDCWDLDILFVAILCLFAASQMEVKEVEDRAAPQQPPKTLPVIGFPLYFLSLVLLIIFLSPARPTTALTTMPLPH